jgi:hypothetical protein
VYEEIYLDENENYEKENNSYSKILTQSSPQDEDRRIVYDEFVLVGHGIISLSGFDTQTFYFDSSNLRRLDVNRQTPMQEMQNHMRRHGGTGGGRIAFNNRSDLRFDGLSLEYRSRAFELGGIIHLSGNTQAGIAIPRIRHSTHFYLMTNRFQEPVRV